LSFCEIKNLIIVWVFRKTLIFFKKFKITFQIFFRFFFPFFKTSPKIFYYELGTALMLLLLGFHCSIMQKWFIIAYTSQMFCSAPKPPPKRMLMISIIIISVECLCFRNKSNRSGGRRNGVKREWNAGRNRWKSYSVFYVM
jgi:hypothetical protein